MSTITPLDSPTTAPPHAARQTQRHAALARANAIRQGRAALKRSIQAGRRSVEDVIANCPPEAASMPVLELLGAQHRWGETRTLRLLRRAELPETKHVGQLTPRQRRALVACLQQPNAGA